MNAFTESNTREKRENQQNYSQNEPENVRVVHFPKEVTVFGNISRVYVEGNEKHEKLIFDLDQPSGSREDHRERTKNYIIIPVKDRNSEIQFVKAPIYKLSKKPKAKKVEDAKCQKLNPYGEETTFEDLPKWSAEKTEIYEWKEFVSTLRTDTETVFTFRQTDRNGQPRKSEFQRHPSEAPPFAIRPQEDSKKQLLKDSYVNREKSSLAMSDSTEHAPKEPQDPPPTERRKPIQSADGDFPRILQYLITLKGKNKRGKRFQ